MKRLLMLIFMLLIVFKAAPALAQDNYGIVSGAYIYPVMIEGKKYNFIFGTASAISSIDVKVARTLKNTIKTPENTEAEKPETEKPTIITLPEISVGDHVLYNTQMMISSEFTSAVEQVIGIPVDGILGMNVYNQFIWDIDNKNKKITAISVNNKPKKEYNQCIYYQLDVVPILNNITKDGQVLSFVMGTNLNNSMIHSELIKPLKLIKATVYNIGNGMQEIIMDGKNTTYLKGDDRQYYYLDDFAFGTIPIKRYLFEPENGDYLGGLSGVLGFDFFNRFDQWQLNPMQQTLCFNSFDNQAENLLRIMRMRAYNGHIELYRNNDRYLKKLNLKNGDVIVSLDNKPYRPDQIEAVRNKLLYQDSVDVEIERNGEIFHVVVK